MQIELNNKQYRHLVMLFHLGALVQGTARQSRQEEWKDIEELGSHLLSYAKDFEAGDLVKEKEGNVIFDPAFDAEVADTLNEYNEKAFWPELIMRLGQRDFLRDQTKEEAQRIQQDGVFPKHVYDKYEKYEKEFDENGIDRLEIS